MAFYGTLESLIEYAHPSFGEFPLQKIQERNKEPDALENLLTEKVRCLSDILADVSKDIASRAKLSENIIYCIYQHYLYVKYHLLILERWPLDGIRAIEQRRSTLEKQLDALLQEKRAEQVKCWQDVARLKEEGRKWCKQYRDLRERVRLIVTEQRM
jgi:hypothetical protein